MTERLANEAASTLAAGIDADDLTLTVASATAFPGAGNFRVRIDDELLLVTGVAGAVFTVTRAVESTTAAVHASAAAVTHVLTAAALTQFVTENSDATQAELDTEVATRAAADVALDTRVDALEVAPPAHTHDDRYYTESEVDTFIAGRQPVDSDLTAIAALSTTAFGRALLELANAAAGRTAFGLGTAATSATGDFDAAGAAAAAQAASQPLDSDLTAIAALSTTSFGRSLLALADAPALLSAAGAQASDSDLTAIAGIAPSNDDLIQRKAGAWTNRAPAQVKTDLVLVKGDVGLGNVDNTADTAKPVSTAQQTALDLKANLASPALTGNPTAPTPSAADNDTSIATTAFVQGELTAKANLASPTFTGDPKAPTPSAGDNDTSIATTAFVTTADGLLVPKSLIDAKGDLLVGTAADTVARKAVSGTNGRVLKEDSSQSDGLAWGQVGLDSLTSDVRDGAWLPTGRLAHVWGALERGSSSGAMAITSARPNLIGGVTLKAGQAVSYIEFFTHSTAGSGLTHTFFFITDQSRNVLATTLDDTSATWSATTLKTLQIASTIGGAVGGTYTPTVDTPIYLGVCVVGTTVPTLYRQNQNGDIGALAPVLCGQSSTTGLTTPASLPGTVGALTASSVWAWAAVK